MDWIKKGRKNVGEKEVARVPSISACILLPSRAVYFHSSLNTHINTELIMTHVSNNTFEITRLNDPREFDASQRIYVSLEDLQRMQIAAGDLIIVRSSNRLDRVKQISMEWQAFSATITRDNRWLQGKLGHPFPSIRKVPLCEWKISNSQLKDLYMQRHSSQHGGTDRRRFPSWRPSDCREIQRTLHTSNTDLNRADIPRSVLAGQRLSNIHETETW